MTNSVDTDQTAPIGAVCSGPTLFASILNSSLMLGIFLQQTTSAIFHSRLRLAGWFEYFHIGNPQNVVVSTRSAMLKAL